MVLNNVCNIESPYKAAVPSTDVDPLTENPAEAGLGRPHSSIKYPTNARNGLKSNSAHRTPKRLNIVCDIAARFACVFPTDAAILAVIVVPIFSPNTIAHAISNGIHPMLSMISVIAIVAEEDWSTRVSTVPNSKKISTELNP